MIMIVNRHVNEKVVERKYEEIATTVRNEILKYVKDVEAILFIGSFGRKEMSYVIARNGEINFLNDCDVLIITRKKMGEELIKFLRDVISKKVNKNYTKFEKAVSSGKYYNFYVDIRNTTIGDLKKLPPRLKYYDIFHEPNVIFVRDTAIIRKFPKIDIKDIPKEDGLVHVFNRMALLLQFSPVIVTDPNVLVLFISKAYSAIMEAILLLDNNYVVSYRKMVEKFKEIIPSYEELYTISGGLDKRVEYFINLKIDFHLYYNEISLNQAIKMWEQARKDIIYTAIFLINKVYSTNFGINLDSSILDIYKYLQYNKRFILSPYVKNKFLLKYIPTRIIQIAVSMKYFTKYGHNVFSSLLKSLKIPTDITSYLYCTTLLSLSMLSYSNNKLEVNKRLFPKAIKSLLKIYPLKNNVLEINDARSFLMLYAQTFRFWESFIFEL